MVASRHQTPAIPSADFHMLYFCFTRWKVASCLSPDQHAKITLYVLIFIKERHKKFGNIIIIGELIACQEKKRDLMHFLWIFDITTKFADYFASLLLADWSFKEVMKSWCVLLLGLYLARGACVSLIEGSLWHGCSGPPHLEASSCSRWGEIRQG